MKLVNAVIELVKDAENNRGEWVVIEEDGEFYSIPAAYLTDISYTGSRNVVTKIQEGADLFGSDWQYNEETIEEEAQWAVDTYSADWLENADWY